MPGFCVRMIDGRTTRPRGTACGTGRGAAHGTGAFAVRLPGLVALAVALAVSAAAPAAHASAPGKSGPGRADPGKTEPAKPALLPADDPISFQLVIEPVLTRLGCNSGACHGKNAGQGGFRLSLRGYAPEQDHPNITRELAGRRVSVARPEDSLLLRKAMAEVPHVAGAVMPRDSEYHRTLLAWLSAGAPGPKANEAWLRSLAVSAPDPTMTVGQAMQLKVEAEFTDGTRRDVTWLAKFESNDGGLIPVSPEGVVTAKREGETAVRAAFLDQVAVIVLRVPFKQDAGSYPVAANGVDRAVFRKLADLKIPVSDLSTDGEFVRRLFLDTMGILPTADEVRAFLSDTRADKRARMIDAVLARPEFDDFWALQWGDVLQNRRERDHDVRGTKSVQAFHDWIRTQVAADVPWDRLVRTVLTATGDTTTRPEVGYWVVTVGEKRDAHRSEAVAGVAQSFLGTRIGCAECHNHPLERYTQDDYYRFAGFFSRLRLERKKSDVGPTMLDPVGAMKKSGPAPKPDPRKPAPKPPPVGVVQPRTGQFLDARPLDRVPVTIDPEGDPRDVLAGWICRPDNEYFTGNLVNRVVKHYLGTGLVEPVDDLRATNPPSNPELWKELNAEFVRGGLSVRHLMRVILNSRTYQLASATKPGNTTDTRFYSHYLPRRLPAEVMLDAVSAATGVPDRFPGRPLGVRAVQLGDPGVKSYFLSLFGRSERVTACACERSGDVTMAQLLHIQNGDDIIAKLKSADGRLARLLKTIPDDGKLAEELFLATVSRLPGELEKVALRSALADGDPRDEVFRDLFWALLNSKEFGFNH